MIEAVGECGFGAVDVIFRPFTRRILAMRRPPRQPSPVARACFHLLSAGLLAALAAPGCGHEGESEYSSVSKPPTVEVIKPQVRTIVRKVGQPSFIEAYERTAIYPKLTAYIDDWVVDIGDKVRKDEVLATLFVPELVEEYQTKHARVKLDEERVRLAEQTVKVAAAEVKAAEARLEEAKEILGKYDAEVERWNTEVRRLKHEVDRGVVDPQILLESTNQWKSSIASRDAAKATIDKATAELLAARETLAEDQVDVSVASADLDVATSEWKKTGAMVGYLTLRAPFDGIVYERNANTFDFVLPESGDPTANRRSPAISSMGAAPIYVVDRTDIVRIFVDIPERDANYVHGVNLRLIPDAKDVAELPKEGADQIVLARLPGGLRVRCFDSHGRMTLDADESAMAGAGQVLADLKTRLEPLWVPPERPTELTAEGGVWEKVPGGAPHVSPLEKQQVIIVLTRMFGEQRVPNGTRASVLAKGYRDEPIEGTVTRTSWALNVTSRTLRAEIDLPNPGGQLLPGMYAYADVIIERPDVMALPEAALSHVGDQTFCWLYQDGKARRVEVRTGISDGEWIEVTNLEKPTKSRIDHPWEPVRGSEQIILGDLTLLADGAPVEVAKPGDKVAGEQAETSIASTSSEGDDPIDRAGRP
jgi:hypothetical protein